MIHRISVILILLVFIFTFNACSGEGDNLKDKKVEFKTKMDSVSYFIGAYNLGKPMRKDSVMIDPIVLAKGIYDALYGDTVLISEEQGRKLMMSFQEEMMKNQQRRQKELSESNKKDGAAFLEANKKKPGVISLPSGLQYQVIKEGTGVQPKMGDTVTVHYKGMNIKGKIFDNSYDRKEPFKIALDTNFVKGWVEGLLLMKEGAKYKLFIPSNLGYGENPGPPEVGPNGVMIFELELLAVTKPNPNAPQNKPSVHEMQVK
ncbi:MAG: FKBP-type peptidyl-prolyl cis-trans isomerase [Bacteroidetes bacterium]|nr:MAG: FKBP-type peptidyl-prolyl cis-trans isomerase [Bacteroidota bacterium]